MSFEVVHPEKISAHKIILLGPGLNNPISIMDAIGHWFPEAILVRLTLTGHDIKKPLPHLSPNKWQSSLLYDMEEAILFCEDLSRKTDLPLIFCGYSLSCLLWTHVISQRESNPFAQAIFLAPALKAPSILPFLSFTYYLGKKIQIPSFNKPFYRVHSSIPSSLYKAIYQITKDLEKRELTKIPLLIFVHRKDKVISAKKLSLFIQRKKLQSTLIEITSRPQRKDPSFHILFEPKVLGQTSFEHLKQISRTFLFTHNKIETISLAPYEHYFINDSSKNYPPLIKVILKFKSPINGDLLDEAQKKVQNRHPFLKALILGEKSDKREHLQWITLDDSCSFSIQTKKIDETTVQFFLHHAAVDGIGSILFIRELLYLYFHQEDKLEKLDYDLRKRISPPISPKNILSLFFSLKYLFSFITFSPSPIRSQIIDHPSTTHHSEEVNIEVYSLGKERTQDLIKQSKRKNIKVNTLLLTALFNALYEWNHTSSSSGQKMRISMPINHRNSEDRSLVACNKTGIYFVDRTLTKKLTLDDAYSLEKEMNIAKFYKLSFLFNKIISFMGNFNQGIKCFITPPSKEVCSTTTCLSNLGHLDFENKEIDSLTGSAPLRPGTRATFGAITLNHDLQLSCHYDTRFFYKKNAQQILTCFSKELISLVEDI